MTKCYDCGRPYGDEHGFPDLVIPSQIWREVSPTKNDGGMLCPSCICQRLHAAGYEEVPGAFMSGPIKAVHRAHMDAIRDAENAREENEKGKRLYTELSNEKCRLIKKVCELEAGQSPMNGRF